MKTDGSMMCSKLKAGNDSFAGGVFPLVSQTGHTSRL